MTPLQAGPWRVHLLTDCAPAPVPAEASFPDAAIAGPAARWFPGGDFATRFGVVLLRGPDGDMLIDCGMGPGPSPYFPGLDGALPAALAACGAALDSIRTVIFTHLHVDHVGWAPFLPRAEFIVAGAEWAHWCKPDAGLAHHRDSVARCIAPLAAAGRLRTMEAGPVAPAVELLAAAGHTPGHHSVLLDGALLVAGDLWHNPAQVEMPGWCHRADHDKPQAAATRGRIAARAAEQGWLVACGHFTPGNALGRIAATPDGLGFFALASTDVTAE